LSNKCKSYEEIKKTEKEERRKKYKTDLGEPLGPESEKEPAAHLVFPETVSRFPPYLADRWTPPCQVLLH
jgi:hypothetical protein